MPKIDWDRVHKALERDRHKMIWKPYGLPHVGNPYESSFHDAPIAPPWKVPDVIAVSVAITGAFMTQRENPRQPLTVEQIRDQAIACATAGASAIHIHVRDDAGYNVLSPERFSAVIGPLRERCPHLVVDGCLVPALDGEWADMMRVLAARTLDAVPINTTATYVGDSLFVKPISIILEKTRLVLEHRAKPIIACYVDGDVSNADRLLFKSGLLGPGQTWIILPALPGCSPMDNPRQMTDGLLRMSTAIFDVDPRAVILVCAAGRASSWLVNLAALLGLHIRVGMEDTIWRWPHRDDLIQSNIEMLETAKHIAAVLGRRVATHAEYRALIGLQES